MEERIKILENELRDAVQTLAAARLVMYTERPFVKLGPVVEVLEPEFEQKINQFNKTLKN